MIKLTQTVQKGGCAAKVAANVLREILSGVKFPPLGDNVLVDASLFDDAAVIQISNDKAMIQTLDFFTPIVDTPYLFGQIAAANSLSDVYAMGGLPDNCMAILAFPLASMPNEVITGVMQGACDKITEAKARLLGGHSIDDDTLKFGLSVTGFVHPKKVWSNSGAQVGDVLILTKPLGTGTMTAALKRGNKSEEEIAEATLSMTTLNDVPVLLSDTVDVHAATDITGFGLVGHAMHIANASKVKMEFCISAIPRFAQALDVLEGGNLTKAHKTNAEYVGDVFAWLSHLEKLLVCDPQTSGGLLLSVSSSKAEKVLAQVKTKFQHAEIVATVKEGSGISFVR